MSRRGSTPLGAIAGGLLAGAVGTAAMDALLFSRYRRDGGKTSFRDWVFSSGLNAGRTRPQVIVAAVGILAAARMLVGRA